MKESKQLKVAVVHDQLTQYGGAERTLEQILDIFPEADIFTGFRKPINITRKILDRKITSGPAWLRYLGFLMPMVFESFDLRQYDLVISEGTAWPKGVITSPNQLHVHYVYTPPRFLYGYATEGQKRDIWYLKPFLKIIDHFLRVWDYSAAQRPDYILSISKEVAGRVKKYYGRGSLVIYPPVELPERATDSSKPGDYYLCVSRLAAYKNIDLLIDAFKIAGLKLKIAGMGKEEARLRTLIESDGNAGNIELLGFVSDDDKTILYSGCKGFIFPTDREDFGIVLVEALSFGKPVLSHKSGGPLEIITEGKNGMFFDTTEPEKLAKKVIEFDRNIDAGLYDRKKAVDSSKKFSADRFKEEFRAFIFQKLEEKRNGGTT